MSEQPWIDDPPSYVDSLLQNYSNDPNVQSPKKLLKLFVDSFYHRLLGTESKLTLHNGTQHLMKQKVFDGKLCVLRGMVQDIGESELFVMKYKQGSNVLSTFLRDSTIFPEDCNLSEGNVDYGDRLSLIVKSVPGECSWVTEHLGLKYDVCNQDANDAYGVASKVCRYGDDAPRCVEVKFYGNEKDISINSVFEFVGVFEQVLSNNNEPNESGELNILHIHLLHVK